MIFFALTTSLILTFLVATAVIARSGLRGGLVLLVLGLLGGLIIGPFEIALNRQGDLLAELIQPLLLQFVLIGIVKAVVFALAVSVSMTMAASMTSKSRRRGDIWNVAVGLGCGLGLSTTTTVLIDTQSGWPPFVLVTALANMPFQLCFTLVVSAALLRSRFPEQTSGLPPWSIYTMAVALGACYQAILQATLTIGHWLAWMEPTYLGMIWLTLIALFWFTGLAVMASLQLTAIPSQFSPRRQGTKPPLLLRAGLWKLAAWLVIAPALVLFAVTWIWNIDTPIGRVLIYTLLATPLLAGSIFLRTALALEDKPLQFRLR